MQPSAYPRPALPMLQLEMSCDYSSIRQGAGSLRVFLEGCGLPEKDIWACELCLVEACNNIVQHAPAVFYCRPIEIQVSCSPGEVEIRITDLTTGFAFPEASSLPPAAM